ncbi:MAG: glycosyltransferase family 4 protein [Candidatus Buchananbacteria bacterium]
MKIAFIGQKGIPTQQGGIEKHVEELSTRLAKGGFDVTVYSRPHYSGITTKKYKHKGVDIINLPSINTKNLDAITHTFISSIHAISKNYDVIHYHGVGPSLLSWMPRVFSPKSKVVVTFHSIDRLQKKWGPFAKLMLTVGEWAACKFPHETITASKIMQIYTQKHFNSKTNYIPNGVGIPKVKETEILKKLGLRKKQYILCVSRLIQHKGIHTLIKAYKKLDTNKKLVIVGEGSNTESYIKLLKKLADGDKNIIFAGKQIGDDLKTIFTNAFVFVQPSEAEGLSIALLEAMSYGLPLIISDIPENKEPTNGYALEFINKNFMDLSRQLNFAIKHPNHIRETAKTAKEHTIKHYNWNDITKKTANLYEQLIWKTKKVKAIGKRLPVR